LLGMQDSGYALMRDAVARKDLGGAVEAFDSAVFFSAGMPGYELWSSRQLAVLKDWKRASAASALAEREGEERFSALYQSSVLAVASSDLPGAVAKAREAIAMAPNWYKPHLLLAQIFEATGNGAEGSREADVSAGLGWRR